MKNTLRQVFHSSKFVVGFVIFIAILLTMFTYPIINPGNPLEMMLLTLRGYWLKEVPRSPRNRFPTKMKNCSIMGLSVPNSCW